MIETVVSVKLPVRETLRIKKNSLYPDVMTGREKRICLVSGLYGDELGGQYICGAIIQRIKEDYDSLSGIVDVYPSVNPLGLDARSRSIPVTQEDYSAVFPGDLKGDLGAYTAAKLLGDMESADCVIDIHSSNIFLQEIPQVRLNSDADEHLLRLAGYMNTDLIWIHPSTTVNEGSLSYALNERGVPCMVTESGAAFRIKYDFCRQIIEGVFAVMKELGIWKGPSAEPKRAPVVHDDGIHYLNCETNGLFVTHKKVKDHVKKGEIIGSVTSPILGAVEEEIIAPVDGILMTVREHPGVTEGSLIARVVGGDLI